MSQMIPIRALKDNYIWLIQDDIHHQAFVVDPGDAAPVIHYLHEHRLTLAGIFITHHHSDHSAGIADLLNQYGTVPVYGFIHSQVPHVSHFVKEGDVITCGEIVLQVAEIPGHTLDHITFYNNEIIFCGDTLFSAGCGRVFEGTYEQMYDSLNKLFHLSDFAKIYCGHEYTLQNLQFAKAVEPDNHFIQTKMEAVKQLLADGKPTLPSLLREEKSINPFLRCKEKTVIQAVENHTQKTFTKPEEIFKGLREWKNHF